MAIKPRSSLIVLVILAFNIGCTAQQVAEFERDYEKERIKNEHKHQSQQHHQQQHNNAANSRNPQCLCSGSRPLLGSPQRHGHPHAFKINGQRDV